MKVTIKPLEKPESFSLIRELFDGIYIGNNGYSDGPLVMVIVQKANESTLAVGFAIKDCDDIRAWNSADPRQVNAKLYNVIKVKPDEIIFREVML